MAAAMSELVVETPEGLTLRYEIAGAGSRSAAAMIDTAIWVTVTLVVFLVFLFAELEAFAIWVATGSIISLIAYHVLFAVFGNGATPGKRVLGLMVVSENGLPASWSQHVLRGLFWPVEAFIPVPVPFGIVMMAATPRHQRLGDMVAGTLVLRPPSRRATAEPFKRTRWSTLPNHRLELVPAHAARFDGEDVDFLRELLGRTRVDVGARKRLFRSAARHYAGVLEIELEPQLDARDSRAMLAELYVFLREMRSRD